MINKINRLIIAIILLAVSGVKAQEKVADKIIARINNEVILLSEFKKRAEPIIEEYNKNMADSPDKEEKLQMIKEELLEQMIDEKLLLQEAENKDIYVSDAELDQGVDEIKERFNTEMEFQNELSNQGYTGEKFRQNIADQLKVIKLINQEVKSKVKPPTEDEIKEYYEEHEEEMVSPEAVKARHILIKVDENKSSEEALKEIEEIYKEAKENPDKFSNLAEKYSEGPSASQGGNLGYFARGEMVEEFEDKAFDMRVGQISKPVKTMFGYHIIKVTGHRMEEKRTFSEARGTLKNLLYQQNMKEEYEKYLSKLHDEAKISKQLFDSE